MLVYCRASRCIFHKHLDHILSVLDALQVENRHRNPLAQESCAHGGTRFVERLCKREVRIATCRSEEFEVARGELINPHILLTVKTRQRGDMRHIVVLCKFEVVEYRSRSRNGTAHTLHAKAFERWHREVRFQFAVIDIVGENPIFEAVDVVSRAKGRHKSLLQATLIDNLFWCKRREQLFDIAVITLGNRELARSEVEERHTRSRLSEIDRCEVVVFALLDNIIFEYHTRCNHLDNTSAHYISFCGFGVFELFADSHTLAGTHQAWEIGVYGVMRKSCKLHRCSTAIGTASERNAEYGTRLDSVCTECLIEIAHSEQQKRIGILRLHLIVLLHQLCLARLLLLLFACFLSSCQSLLPI